MPILSSSTHPDDPSPVRSLTELAPDLVEPDANADELAVARYLVEVRQRADIQLSEAMAYCKRRYGARPGFRLGQVLTYAGMLPSKERRSYLGKVRKKGFAWLALSLSAPDWIYYCPRTLWKMHKYTGNVYWMEPPCDNWRCTNRCAETKANDIIDRACDLFLQTDRVWYAVLPFEDHLHDWLRQRRERSAGGALWVHRNDTSKVHVFATADLSSRQRPNLGNWLSPLDALNRLVDPTLTLPGVQARRWLGTWKPEPEPAKAGHTFPLGSAPHDLMKTILSNAKATLERTHGTGALDRLTADDVENVWLPIVQAEKDKQWEIRKAAAQQPGLGAA